MVRLENEGGGGDNSEPRSRANNTKCVGLMGGRRNMDRGLISLLSYESGYE